jgi:acyl dehydratase
VLEEVVGSVYGPLRYRTCVEKVSEFVEATGDDPGRWVDSAPPALAGALLFVVAPALLADPRLAGFTGSVIHGDQSFAWHAPIPLETDLEVSGSLTKARERGGVLFTGFDVVVTANAERILDGSSTFLMAAGSPPAGSTAEEPEPEPGAGSHLDPATLIPLPPIGEEVPQLTRGVSRAGLVRYAAASRDFNPIHWDHSAAVGAGLAGVVVHGLLQSAWMIQTGCRLRPGERPVAGARFRYRAPLRPGVAVSVHGVHKDEGVLDLRLSSEVGDHVSAVIELAP